MAVRASAGAGFSGAATRGSSPAVTTMVWAPAGRRSKNSVAPLCTASSICGVVPDAASMTMATDRLLEATGVTVVGTRRPPIVTDTSSDDRSRPDGFDCASTTMETCDCGPVWTAITRGLSANAQAADQPGTRTTATNTTATRITAAVTAASASRTAARSAAPSPRCLIGEDHDIVTVMPRGGIERAAAGDQPDLGLQGRVVDQLAGKQGLLVAIERGHHESCGGAVRPIDQHLVPGASSWSRKNTAGPVLEST